MEAVRNTSDEKYDRHILSNCDAVDQLNALVRNGQIRELIRTEEARHEMRFSQIADELCRRNARVVMLSGPSSSGKTTSANRLATQLRVHGMKPVLVSLDDYYLDRDTIKPEPDGTLDLEHIHTIDTKLFSEHISRLLCGGQVLFPSFSFLTGKRGWKDDTLSLDEGSVIIVEGIHALNPILLPSDIEKDKIFRLYVSPLLTLDLYDHNRITGGLLRLMRRIVRDYKTRDSSVQRTLSMWDSVRRGEKRWILPYQNNADMTFNSATLYELPVLKKHICPLLAEVQPDEQICKIAEILNHIHEADVDGEIPPASIVREFIGGNSFYE